MTLQQEHEHLLPEFLDWVTEPDGKKQLHLGPYMAHIDLARTVDAAGFAVGHIVGSKKVSRGFGPERKFETRPVIRVDLALQIVAPPRGEIRISSVRELLYKLRDMGMQFGRVSYDSWGSDESIQTLKGQGFSAEVLSVDTDSGPYEKTKEAIYDGRLECYPMPILEMELATLRRDDKTGKIDHPPHGHKDVSDALAGVVQHCENAFATGTTSEWANVATVQPEVKFGFADRQQELWWKIENNIPLTEARNGTSSLRKCHPFSPGRGDS